MQTIQMISEWVCAHAGILGVAVAMISVTILILTFRANHDWNRRLQLYADCIIVVRQRWKIP